MGCFYYGYTDYLFTLNSSVRFWVKPIGRYEFKAISGIVPAKLENNEFHPSDSLTIKIFLS